MDFIHMQHFSSIVGLWLVNMNILASDEPQNSQWQFSQKQL
jgi:hypothetical protein